MSQDWEAEARKTWGGCAHIDTASGLGEHPAACCPPPPSRCDSNQVEKVQLAKRRSRPSQRRACSLQLGWGRSSSGAAAGQSPAWL